LGPWGGTPFDLKYGIWKFSTQWKSLPKHDRARQEEREHEQESLRAGAEILAAQPVEDTPAEHPLKRRKTRDRRASEDEPAWVQEIVRRAAEGEFRSSLPSGESSWYGAPSSSSTGALFKVDTDPGGGTKVVYDLWLLVQCLRNVLD